MKLYRILMGSLLFMACNSEAEKKKEPASIGPVSGSPPLDTTVSTPGTAAADTPSYKGKTISLDTVLARKKAKAVK